MPSAACLITDQGFAILQCSYPVVISEPTEADCTDERLTVDAGNPGPLQNNSVTLLLAARSRLEDDCSVSVTRK